jgi:trans-aconitate 2-methyltransferase
MRGCLRNGWRGGLGHGWPRGRIHSVSAGIAWLPFAGVAEAVFTNAALHWVLDGERLFASLHAALAPGGRLEAQCGGGENLMRLRARADGLRASAPYAAHFADWRDPWRFDDVATAEARLRRAGFIDVRAWIEEAPTRFADEHAWRAFVA